MLCERDLKELPGGKTWLVPDSQVVKDCTGIIEL